MRLVCRPTAWPRVKFWIIKNYVSPQHKRVIPMLAAKFGFEVEFVTYKWPHWLHKQVRGVPGGACSRAGLIRC